MKITIALALVASGASAWEIPEDAYTQFPIEHLPRDETGGIDHGRELWKYWEPPKAMTECFDYDKCKTCWMKECTEEADDAYNECRKWDEMKTDWMMQEGGKCEKAKLNPSKAGDREMCQAYGECVYKECGYDCDNVRSSVVIDYVIVYLFVFGYVLLYLPTESRSLSFASCLFLHAS